MLIFLQRLETLQIWDRFNEYSDLCTNFCVFFLKLYGIDPDFLDVKEPKCTCGQSFREAAPWSNANCFVVVTGASRGFGRAFCIQLLREVAEPRSCHCPPAVSLTFFLLGRDVNALCETESEVDTLTYPFPLY